MKRWMKSLVVGALVVPATIAFAGCSKPANADSAPVYVNTDAEVAQKIKDAEDALKAQIAKLEGDKTSLQTSLSNKEAELKTALGNVTSLTNAKSDLENAKEALEGQKAGLQSELEGQISELEREIERLTAIAREVKSTEQVVASIAVTKMPTKTTFFTSDKFDSEGLEVTATYNTVKTLNDGTKVVEEATSTGVVSATVATPTMTTAGTKNVTVSYEGKTATYSITVVAVAVDRITVDTNKIKTEYEFGESFDATGLELQLVNNDDTNGKVVKAKASTGTLAVNEGYFIVSEIPEISASNIAGLITFVTNVSKGTIEFTTAGEHTVYVGYMPAIGLTTLGNIAQIKYVEITVTVAEPAFYAEIEVTGKTEYTAGEQLSLVVNATTYNKGGSVYTASREVKNYTVSGFDSKKVGAQTITVSYEEWGKTVTATYEVVVKSQETMAEGTASISAISFGGVEINVENINTGKDLLALGLKQALLGGSIDNVAVSTAKAFGATDAQIEAIVDTLLPSLLAQEDFVNGIANTMINGYVESQFGFNPNLDINYFAVIDALDPIIAGIKGISFTNEQAEVITSTLATLNGALETVGIPPVGTEAIVFTVNSVIFNVGGISLEFGITK